MGEQPPFSFDDIEFAKIIKGDPETALLVVETPLWQVAVGDPMARKVANETALAVREDCQSRLEAAQAENPLFHATLSELYLEVRRLEGGPSNSYRVINNLVSAARITTDLPNPASALEIIETWEDPAYRERNDFLSRSFLEKADAGEINDLPPRVKEKMIKIAKASLDPQQRAATYELVLKTLYDARYDAYKAMQS